MAEILQKVSRLEKSICGKCAHRFVCKAIDNQPCFECNHFTEEVVNGNSLIPKWISVSDELPAQYRVVIGWTKFKEMGEVEHDGKKFVWANEETVPAFVTHWMPFPEPPKGEEKNERQEL